MAESGETTAVRPRQPILRGQAFTGQPPIAWNAMSMPALAASASSCLTAGSMSSLTPRLAQQVYLYGEYKAGRGSLAATPGTSNHGWGLAVDLATQEMRSIVDRIGREYGYSKTTSDAPSEWWHIKWVEGSWRGIDVGPYGRPVEPSPEPITEDDVITAVVKQNGAIEVFVEKASSGEVFHAWQSE